MQFILTLTGTTFGTEVSVHHTQVEVAGRLTERLGRNPGAEPSLAVRV